LTAATPRADALDAGVKAGGQSLLTSETMSGTMARLSSDWNQFVDDSWKRLSAVFDFQSLAESGRGFMAGISAIWESLFGPAEENSKTAEQLMEAYKSGAETALDVFGGIVEISIRTREIFWGIVDGLFQFAKNIPGLGWAVGDAPSMAFDGNAEREALNQVLAPIRERFANMTVEDFMAQPAVDPVEADKAADGMKQWVESLAGSKTGLDAINAEYEKSKDQLAVWANKVGNAFLETAEGAELYYQAQESIDAKRQVDEQKFLETQANQLLASIPDPGSFNVAGREIGSGGLADSIAAAISGAMGGRQSTESQMIAALEMQNRHQEQTAENTAALVRVLSRVQPGQSLQFGGAF
jgi:hypothetical protein